VKERRKSEKDQGKSERRAGTSKGRDEKEQGRAREEPEKNEGRGIRASDIPDERHPAAQCSELFTRQHRPWVQLLRALIQGAGGIA